MRNVILRAVGVNEVLAVDIIKGPFQAADTFLLCSDGLSDMITDQEIESILMQGLAPEITARRLVDAANEAGGKDNITAVVVRVE
jgi:protein phosphatase